MVEEEFDIAAKEAAAAVVDIEAAAEAVLQRDPFAPFAAEEMLHYWAQQEQLVVKPMVTWRLELQELIVVAALLVVVAAVLQMAVVAVLLAAEAEAEADESQIQASEASDPQTEAMPLKQLAVDILEAQHSAVVVVVVVVVVVSVLAAH